MTIKLLFNFGFIFLLLACAQKTDKKETLSKEFSTDRDTLTTIANLDKVKTVQTGRLVSPNLKELNNALADPTIDDYYKEIYNKEKIIPADDDKMLSITEKLFIKDRDKELFYFIVFTKSMNGSDGFYSEAVGLSALEFITTKTKSFVDYFNTEPKLNDKDLANWANYIYGEIQISREDGEENAVNELENKLLENIKGANKEYEIVVRKFIKNIKSTMP